MLKRLLLAFALAAAAAPALAQSGRTEGEMRLYIQELEARVRDLTGENERLQFELRRAQERAAAGAAPAPTVAAPAPAAPAPSDAAQAAPVPTAPVAASPPAPAGAPAAGSAAAAAPPQDLGQVSVAPDDPRIAPDGATAEPGADLAEEADPDEAEDAAATAALPAPATPAGPSSGNARDAYDLAYGYILTGDYPLAEKSLSTWLESYPEDPLADDARFWMGESQFRQNKYREAATAFLDYYKRAPEARKAPSALVKLGVSLAALGETQAACGTLREVERKYPDLGATVKAQVAAARQRAGC